MTRNIKLVMEYDGTRFHGWQVQSHNSRTVQGVVEKALDKILQKKIRLTGSGRTDSGVHAIGQVANFKTTSAMPCETIVRALNARLPEDAVILSAQDVKDDFHAQFSAKRKTYRYRVLMRATPCAQDRFFCYHFPHKLNLFRIRKAARDLCGEKDFRCFMAADAAQRDKQRQRDTVRQVSRLDVRKQGDYLTITIEANGFLYKMVRNIVGTLLEIGAGRFASDGIKGILKTKDRRLAGRTVPARGLCLMEVVY
jgi:tRNA pseudouridine38-40 synthase